MKTSRDDLILDNINLIYYVLKKMNLYKNADEYYDIGMIGLIKAVDTFDESKGYTFSTYGISCIRSELLGYIRQQNRNKRKSNYNTISLEMTIYQENDDREINLIDTLPSKVNIEEEIIANEEKELLEEALKILNDKELLVISYMFGINGYDEIKQKDIATILGMQQGSVSRIGKRAINKMKYYLKVNRGVDYGR